MPQIRRPNPSRHVPKLAMWRSYTDSTVGAYSGPANFGKQLGPAIKRAAQELHRTFGHLFVLFEELSLNHMIAVADPFLESFVAVRISIALPLFVPKLLPGRGRSWFPGVGSPFARISVP